MFRFRLAPLRTAALFAVGFVALRIVYRVVFGGANGGGAVIVDAPSIPLGGPFSHITLLGTVTTGGVSAAAESAIPFAAVILAFGLVSAVVNVGALFARAATRGPIRSLSRAAVIAWATFPALVSSARRMSHAARLRGSRPGPATLAPIFEHTIERAIALAATLEVRGFAADEPPIESRSTRVGSVDTQPEQSSVSEASRARSAVSLVNASLSFGGTWRLAQLTLSAQAGTVTIISGATGSGKSSLLHSISGLFQHIDGGIQEGEIWVGETDRATTPPRNTASAVGVVMQNSRLSFAAETVREELGYALTLAGQSQSLISKRVEEIAKNLTIAHLLDRSITELSAGQAGLVALGAALVSRPKVLLVDEPLADLDQSAREIVCATLTRLAHHEGMCVIVAEHAIEPWGSDIDALWNVHGESVTVSRATNSARAAVTATAAIAAQPALAAQPAPEQGASAERGAPVVAHATALSVHYGNRTQPIVAVESASLDLRAGEIVALKGPNGAGKSSLLQELALPRTRATLSIARDGEFSDVAQLRAKDRFRAIALVPENVDDLFVTLSVAEECRRADPSGKTANRFAGLLSAATPSARADLMARHPRDLSAGERVCLAIAVQLAGEPTVLLIDEPTRGLDSVARSLVGAAITHAARGYPRVVETAHDGAANGATNGDDSRYNVSDRYSVKGRSSRAGSHRTALGPRATAVLFATHDTEFASAFAHRTIFMDAARLSTDTVSQRAEVTT